MGIWERLAMLGVGFEKSWGKKGEMKMVKIHCMNFLTNL